MNPEQQQLKRYTGADYDSWPEDYRCELIDGVLFEMHMPTLEHQAIAGEVYRQLANFLLGRRCKPFVAPFAVRLNFDTDDDTIFEPDVIVICDPSKVARNGHKGAPDMAVEVLSPSTRKKDKTLKLQKYQQYGIRELWIIDPEAKTVDAYRRVNEKYALTYYDSKETAPVIIFPGCEINLTDVFGAYENWGTE